MKTVKQHKGPKYRDYEAVPQTYRELCNDWLPRPIHDDAASTEATAMIDALAGFPLNPDQEDYLEAVSHFVNEYDGDYSPEVSGLELLRHLVEENRLTGVQLSEVLGGSRMLGAMILRGDRRITADHARRLGERFGMEPGAFL